MASRAFNRDPLDPLDPRDRRVTLSHRAKASGLVVRIEVANRQSVDQSRQTIRVHAPMKLPAAGMLMTGRYDP